MLADVFELLLCPFSWLIRRRKVRLEEIRRILEP
jgi:hypothetical protein